MRETNKPVIMCAVKSEMRRFFHSFNYILQMISSIRATEGRVCWV